MKKSKKILSIVLAFMMLFSAFSASTGAYAASEAGQKFTDSVTKGFTNVLSTVITTILGAVNLPIRNNPDFINEKDYQNHDFYEGDETFLKEAGDNAAWMLGSASVSLLPDDILSKNYYLGGFIMIENGFTNKVEDVADDMRARVIAIDDNSGRGVSLFATIDCIGMTNGDIKEIRKLVAEKFAEKYPDVKLASINVSSTHCHSELDTQGLWTNGFAKIFKNLFKNALGLPMEQGTDAELMDSIFTKVSDAMLTAYENMKPGKLTYSVKDIGEEYFSNKNRKSCTWMDTKLTRLMFTPNDGSKATVIVNIGAHPDVAGLPLTDGKNKGRTVSGDYVYYMGEYINKCGYDFMFFNGAICGIYIGRGPTNDSQDMEYRWEQSRRYGYEIAKMALALNKTEEEIKADPDLYDEALIAEEMAMAEKNNGLYTLWCEGWEPVEEVDVDPFFNIKLDTVEVPITNNLILMAGKLNLANYDVIKCGFLKYKINVEIGYIEFGNQFKACLVPGELVEDLVAGGGSLTAEGSHTGKTFPAPTLYETFGEVTVFGLTNDAIGYIVPDNDYSMGIVNDHFQEALSLGSATASSLLFGFAEMAQELGIN